jgi:hypothetical protein
MKIKLSYKQKIFIVFLTLFMGANGAKFCKGWFDLITVVPCLAFMAFIVGLALVGVAELVLLILKPFRKART